jgi:hypothetical protein
MRYNLTNEANIVAIASTENLSRAEKRYQGGSICIISKTYILEATLRISVFSALWCILARVRAV